MNRAFHRASALIAGLRRDTGGNVLPLAAMSMVVMAALVGGGVDMSRAYRVQNRLQNACDAGALAGRRAIATNGFDTAAQTQAKKYFDVNFDETLQGTTATTRSYTADSTGNTITGGASTQMAMLVMKLFGRGPMTINASCSSTMGVGNSDVMMVLDVTGSMGSALDGGTRMSALKTAMKNFRTTMANSTAGSNARVRYGFVPFSTTVNVGKLLKDENPAYLADKSAIQSRQAWFDTEVTKTYNGWTGPVYDYRTVLNNTPNGAVTVYSSAYATQAACNAALPADWAWTNSGSASSSSGNTGTTKNGSGQSVPMTMTTQAQTMRSFFCMYNNSQYYQYYYVKSRTYYSYSYTTSDTVKSTSTTQTFDHFDFKPVTYDTSTFKTFAAVTTKTNDNGANQSSTWTGCIEERATKPVNAFSYSNTSGITPSEAYDLDLDEPPTSDPTTKWAPLWTNVAQWRNTGSLLMSKNADTTDSTNWTFYPATSYCVPAAQSFETMTQTEYEAYADSLTSQGSTYLDIGMIWGGRLSSPEGIFADNVNEDPANGGNITRHIIFMTDGDMDGENSIYQSYGIEELDRRVTSDGSDSQEDSRHAKRLRAVCDAIKAKGIRLWVIAFTGSMTSDLTYCASPSSSYLAANSAQLNTAFQDIAKQVGELRVLN